MPTTTLRTDGRTKVWYVPTLSSMSSPSKAQLDAGTPLECQMTPDGLVGFEPSTSEIDNSALCSSFTTKQAGRAEFSGTMVRLMKSHASTDTIYNLLVRDLLGYIVIRRGPLSETAWTIGDKAEVYKIETGETKNLAPEANGLQKYEVPFTITDAPVIRATVAA